MNVKDFDLATIGELALACQARIEQLHAVEAHPGHAFQADALAASIRVLKAAQAQLLARIAAPDQATHLGGISTTTAPGAPAVTGLE